MTKQVEHGEIGELRRTWKTNTSGSPVYCYLHMKGRVTVQEFVNYMATLHPHIDVDTVMLNWSTAMWTDQPTEKERARHAAWVVSADKAKEAWQRRMYDELKAKYEGGDEVSREQ